MVRSSPHNTRKIAVELLEKIDTSVAPSQMLLEQAFREYTLPYHDRALIKETVWGVLRNRNLLDWIINREIKIDQIKKECMNFLRVGTYQLHFLDKIPSYAVLNEVVGAITHKKNKGFVNAVLRKISNQKSIQPSVAQFENLADYLATKYSHPHWIVDLLIQNFGKEKAVEVLQYNNEESLSCIRVNKLRIGRNQLLEKLKAKDIEVSKTPTSPDGLIIHTKGVQINKLDVYTGGGCDIQKESSQLVSFIVNPLNHERILDACAGSGGKTLHMSALMKNTGEVTALDKNINALDRLRTNQNRLAVKNIKVFQKDFLHFESRIPFDKILIDAPCSGLGTMSRNPEIRFRKQTKDVHTLSQLQASLLEKAAQCIKPQGILVYSVCTFTNEETERVITSFLSSHKDFQLLHIPQKYIPKNSRYTKGKLLIFPHEGMEGFFIAMMERLTIT